MSWLQVAILSIVQGLGEFLPISSSGHLFLLEKIFDIQGDLLLFNVVVHFGSLVAVVIVMWKDIVKFFYNYKILLKLVIATLPAVVVGLLIKDYIDIYSDSYILIGIGFLVTAVVVYQIGKTKGDGEYKNMTNLQSLYIGFMQVFALLPGISRSGSTIFGGSLVKLKKEEALKFAFIMSIPVILGATILELKDLGAMSELSIPGEKILAGFVVSFIVSYLVIKWFLEKIKTINLVYFSGYTLLLGLLSISLYFFSIK